MHAAIIVYSQIKRQLPHILINTNLSIDITYQKHWAVLELCHVNMEKEKQDTCDLP